MRHLRELAVAVCLFFGMEAAAAQAGAQPANDSILSAKVMSALASDHAVNARGIHVDTRAGVVQLTGVVDSEAARTEAVMRARAVPGVTGVRNNLSIQRQK